MVMVGSVNSACELPVGVALQRLHAHADARGALVEGFRVSRDGATLAQFNVVTSKPHVLRGVHLHFDHADHLVMASGTVVVGLYDCRRASTTFGLAATVELRELEHQLTVPPGVAHGFWFPEGGVMVYGLDVEWSPTDELGCRWDDPALGINWPAGIRPELSARDQDAGSLAEMISQFETSQQHPAHAPASTR